MIRKLIILCTLILWSSIPLFTSCSKEKDNFRSVTGNIDPASHQKSSFAAYFPLESSGYVITKGKGIDSLKVVTVGAVKYKIGARGYAYQGDSAQTPIPDASYITIPLNDNVFLKDLKEFTLSSWVKRPKSQNFQEAIILVNGGDSILGSFSLTLDSVYIKGNIYCMSTDSTYTVSVLKTTIPEDNWAFLTFTYNQSTSKLALFANGKLLSEIVCLDVFSTPVGGLTLSSDMTQLFIGAFPKLINGTATSSMAYYSGSVDEIRMWSKCLSNEDISSLYMAESKLAKLP